MPDHLAQELALLPQLGVADLRSRYAQLSSQAEQMAQTSAASPDCKPLARRKSG
jgi:hypothetical protein